MAIYEEIELKPIAKIDEYVALRMPTKKEKYFRVVRIEPIPLYRDDFKNYVTGFTQLSPGDVTTVSKEDAKKILAVETDQLLQYRLFPVDNYEFRYEQYGTRFRIKNKEMWLSKYSAEKYPHLHEWYVYEENVPEIKIRNPTQDALKTLKFDLVGLLYELEEVETKPPKVTFIPLYAEI